MATVKSDALRKVIFSLGEGIIPETPTSKILGCISISFKDKCVILEATDFHFSLQLEIKSRNNLSQNQGQSVSIPYTHLLSLLDEIVEGEVTLKRCDVGLTAECGSTIRTIPCVEDYFPTSEAPCLSNRRGEVSISRKDFKDSVEVCQQFVSKTVTPLWATKINIRVSKDGALAEASDSCLIFQSQFPAVSQDTFSFTLLANVPEKLLLQKWKTLTIAVYEEGIVATDETGKMRFHCTLFIFEYPSVALDGRLRLLSGKVAQITVDPHELSGFFNRIQKLCEFVLVIQEWGNIHLHGCAATQATSKQIHCESGVVDGNNLVWVNLNTEKLAQVFATIPRSVKQVTVNFGNNERSLAIIKYQKEQTCFTIGIPQISHCENTAARTFQDVLVRLYSVPQENREEEAEKIRVQYKQPSSVGLITVDNDETIDVDPTEIFGDCFDDDDDETDGDDI